MKVNEAPERMYIQYFNSNEEDAIYFDDIWTNEPEPKQENIEYIYTDAFIEKACEWLKEYGGGYWMDDYDLPTDELVNDFRNYMKGK